MELDLDSCRKRYRQLQLGVFSRKNSAFLAPLLCSLKVKFPSVEEIDKKPNEWIMGVDGDTLYINPYIINSISFKDGVFILEHELWHIARLHHQRQGNRDPYIWNCACDHVINLAMINDGSSCSIEGLADPKYIGMSEEQIYDDLTQTKNNNLPPKPMPLSAMAGNDLGMGKGAQHNDDNDQAGKPSSNGDSNGEPTGNLDDLIPADTHKVTSEMNNVIRAKQQAQMSNGLEPGSLAGNLIKLWEKILSPKLAWEVILRNLMKDLIPKDKLSWKRRNRRFSNIHLPSMVASTKRLSHLVYAIDTSGSVDEKQLQRINSEIKYVHDHLKPQKLTVIQFDHRLQYVDTFKNSDLYESVSLHGGGGTSYEPVRKFVDDLEERPEGLIIFTDLYAKQMQPLKDPTIPVFWVAVNTPVTRIPFGELIPVEV